MSIKLEKVEEKEIRFFNIEDRLLELLRSSQVPREINELRISLEKIINSRLSNDQVSSAINTLRNRGYDIKEITHGLNRLYVLIRYANYTKDELYRIQGEIETPLLITSDQHLGSKGFSELAWKELVKDIKKYKIKHVMIAGDYLQGRGVHRVELQDLSIVPIGDQINTGIRRLREIPDNVMIHLITGTHEEKIKGNIEVGLDPLQIIAQTLPNVKYYGHVAMLQLNKKYKYMMIHGSGAVSMAVSYKAEKVWRELIEKPNIFHTGHSHQMGIVEKGPNQWIIISGTLQRTNAWLLQKGWHAKIGWWILRDINNDYLDIIAHSPKVY